MYEDTVLYLFIWLYFLCYFVDLIKYEIGVYAMIIIDEFQCDCMKVEKLDRRTQSCASNKNALFCCTIVVFIARLCLNYPVVIFFAKYVFMILSEIHNMSRMQMSI